MNTPSYNTLLNKEKLIKTIQELCEKVNSIELNSVTKSDLEQNQIVLIAEQPIPDTWITGSDSMADLINAINEDETAVPGRMYLSTVQLDDLPYYDDNGTQKKLIQAEMKIEIMAREQIMANTYKDVILFTVTSALPPYHWEYTSVWGQTGEWISFKTD